MIQVQSQILLRAALATDSESEVLPLAQKAWQCIRIDRDGECNPLPFEVEFLFRNVTREPAAASELSNLRLLLVLGVTISKSFRDYIHRHSPLETKAVDEFRVRLRCLPHSHAVLQVYLCDCLNRFVVLHERPANFATNYVELSAALRQLYLCRFSALVEDDGIELDWDVNTDDDDGDDDDYET